MTQNHKKGFTLIELLVVIVIIGILAAGGVSVFQGANQKARDAQRITALGELQLALEQYYTDDGAYPTDVATLCDLIPRGYLKRLPVDPTNTGAFVFRYATWADPVTTLPDQFYELSAAFEHTSNSTKATDDQGDDQPDTAATPPVLGRYEIGNGQVDAGAVTGADTTDSTASTTDIGTTCP